MIRRLGMLLLVLGCVGVGRAQPDSLFTLAATATDDSVRLSALLDLAWEFRNSDAQRSIAFADEAAALARERNDTSSLAAALSRKALTLRKQGDFQQALALVTEAVGYKKAVNDTLGLATALGNLSQTHKAMGNYDSAIAVRLESIDLLQHPDHTPQRMRGINNLASIYASLEDFPKAIEHYKQCQALALKLNDSITLARTWYNLGASWFALEDYSRAEGYYAKALKFAQAHQDEIASARLYNSIGTLHYEKGDPEKALGFFRRAEKAYSELGFAPELVMMYNNIAAAYAGTGAVDQSLAYYHKAAGLADSIGAPKDLAEVYLHLSGTFESENRPDSALHYFKLHTVLRDSLFNVEKNRQILEVQEKYESAEKDRSIAELNRDKLAQQADIRLRNYLLAGAGLVALLAVLFGVNYFQKLGAQKKLAAQKAELNRQSMMEVLKDSELKSINAYIDGETAERERLAGELHDHLGSRLATVKLHYDYLGEHLQHDQHSASLQTANELLAEVLTEVRQLARNLTSGVLHQFGLVSAIEDLCQAISASGVLSVDMDAFELEQRLSPALELALFRAVQELMSNVIKHASATEVSLQLIRHEEQLTIMVSDDGQGFDPESGSGAGGMGLRSIEARITHLGGTFTIDSRSGHGTTCILEVPTTNTTDA